MREVVIFGEIPVDPGADLGIYPARSAVTAIDLPHTTEGQVAEWLKAHAWNACIRESVSRVRIPLCPPLTADCTL